MVDPKTGRFSAHFRPVSVTHRVAYAPVEDGYRVYNAYSQRMRIKGEGPA